MWRMCVSAIILYHLWHMDHSHMTAEFEMHSFTLSLFLTTYHNILTPLSPSPFQCSHGKSEENPQGSHWWWAWCAQAHQETNVKVHRLLLYRLTNGIPHASTVMWKKKKIIRLYASREENESGRGIYLHDALIYACKSSDDGFTDPYHALTKWIACSETPFANFTTIFNWLLQLMSDEEEEEM